MRSVVDSYALDGDRADQQSKLLYDWLSQPRGMQQWRSDTARSLRCVLDGKVAVGCISGCADVSAEILGESESVVQHYHVQIWH